jgi:hypothetical protein
MADDKNKQDGRDRSKVNGNEDYELSYMEEKLNATREEVLQAIKKVGNQRDDVEAQLRKKP